MCKYFPPMVNTLSKYCPNNLQGCICNFQVFANSKCSFSVYWKRNSMLGSRIFFITLPFNIKTEHVWVLLTTFDPEVWFNLQTEYFWLAQTQSLTYFPNCWTSYLGIVFFTSLFRNVSNLECLLTIHSNKTACYFGVLRLRQTESLH